MHTKFDLYLPTRTSGVMPNFSWTSLQAALISRVANPCLYSCETRKRIFKIPNITKKCFLLTARTLHCFSPPILLPGVQHTKTAIAVKGDPGYKGGVRRKYAPDPLNVHIISLQQMIRSLTFSSRPSPPAYPSRWPHRRPCGGTSNLRSLCSPRFAVLTLREGCR